MLRCAVQAVSVHMWVDASRAAQEGRVFHYQMPTADQSFVLGLSSPHMLQQAAELAHGRPLFMDATFGMNDHKVSSLLNGALHHICCKAQLFPMERLRGSTLALVCAVLAVHRGGDGRLWQCAAGRLLRDREG